MRREPDFIDDTTLLRQAQKNDLDALETIHDRYFALLYRYALYRVNDPLAAEDITSDVFIRLLESLKSSKSKPRDLRRWLFGVAHNVVVDHQRLKYGDRVCDLHEDQPMVSHHAHDPVSLLEGSLKIAALNTALCKLKEDQREVLALRFGAELSIKMTAKIMEKSVSAVKVLQFRALKALRVLMVSWK